MNNALRVLHIEDSANDTELIQESLRREGIEAALTRVDTFEEITAAFEQKEFDVIFCDYSLPKYDGLSALRLAREKCPDIPFLFVSGTIGETRAIEALKQGATDYVLKDNLERLGTSVQRAMRESAERAHRLRTEEELRVSAKRLRLLSEHLQKVREEERKRIALEIHDELGQQLTVFKITVSFLEKEFQQSEERGGAKTVQHHLSTLSSMADKSIATVRRIATELRPPELDAFGLVEAMRSQSTMFETRTGISCVFTSTITDQMFREDVATTLFRIFQEALTNVARHSGAKRVTSSFSRKGDTFELLVTDDGKGITNEQIMETQSLGLLGMSERARSLGGTVSITGTQEKGTTVMVSIPA